MNKTETDIVADIRRSVSVVGRLYPVLVDKRGRIIDGKHRLKAYPDWFKVEIPDVNSKEQTILARLISNVCRRNVSPEEKTQMLDALGQIYANQGVSDGEIIEKIVQKTGMSYRWVMKYASDGMKLRPGLGGPKSKRNGFGGVARHATANVIDILLSEPSERVANLTSYSNTSFVTILVERKFYLQLQEIAVELGVDINVIINNGLLMTFQRANQLVRLTTPNAILCNSE